MKKGIILALCTALTLLTTACGEPEIEKQPSKFDEYASNTVIATGNNNLIKEAENVTYRAYFPLEEYGELEYKFYFSNTVDSTWDKGTISYAGMPGGDYEIISARIADGGTSPEDEVTNFTEITFNGSASKSVTSGETFWSDSVTFNIEEGHYLVWEWTISGTNIPALSMSNMLYSFSDRGNGDGNFIYAGEIPLPQLVGAKRDVKLKIVTFGDSITQGSQTTEYATNYWAAEIYEQLGTDYSLWNLGLGYSRASDAALCGDWLERAKSADIVTVAFGTNDLYSGAYGAGRGSTAEEIDGWLRTIVTELKNAGCKVILFNAPPFDFRDDIDGVRTSLNEKIPLIAEEEKVAFFDFAAILADPADPQKALYGGHPNDEGCKIVADTFVETYAELLEIEE